MTSTDQTDTTPAPAPDKPARPQPRSNTPRQRKTSPAKKKKNGQPKAQPEKTVTQIKWEKKAAAKKAGLEKLRQVETSEKTAEPVTEVHEKTPELPAPASGSVVAGPSIIPQAHGGALFGGGVPGHKGANQHTVRQRVELVRGQLIGLLEGVVVDLERMLETARESEGGQPRCTGCGGFIPGISKLKLGDILAVLREVKTVMPAQIEHEGTLHVGVVELPTLITRPVGDE